MMPLMRKDNQTMNKETLINRVSEALRNECGAIFVGSGISYDSTQLDWFKLLKPLTDDLGIKLNEETDDLPLLAQYIVNQYTGNRGPLINQISKVLNKKFTLNDYHKALAGTKVSTLWTTNYDMLLEAAFSEFLADVKVNEDSISRNVTNSEIEIIKMHGCISRSRHEDIVITQEDYEDFLQNKPAISQRLCNDLLQKSFLFIGYSHRDPNIRNIMVTARRLSRKSTQEHYLILKKAEDLDNEACQEKRRRQQLWCDDLKRIGISSLLIEDYNDLAEIMVSISQRSRGKTVYITGSHKDACNTAQQLGTALAEESDVILISGQSTGIGATVVSAFIEKCIIIKQDITARLQIFPNPYAANPKYSDDPSLLPEFKRYRAKLLNSTQVAVIFNGGIGTEAEYEVASGRNSKILPVIIKPEDRESELMRKIFNDKSVMNTIKETDVGYFHKLLSGTVTSEDIIRCLRKMLL
jgi:predicted Rossmann-fold nucleotide-binding protein